MKDQSKYFNSGCWRRGQVFVTPECDVEQCRLKSTSFVPVLPELSGKFPDKMGFSFLKVNGPL